MTPHQLIELMIYFNFYGAAVAPAAVGFFFAESALPLYCYGKHTH